MFGCIAVNTDEGILFKKLIDSKIIELPCVDAQTTIIDDKFMTMKNGRFVEHIPTEINNMSNNIKGKLDIPYGVIAIGDYVFFGCRDLTQVTIPDSVTRIGELAFDGCNSLTSVKIGNGVTSIGDHAFGSCIGLTNVTIPDSVTSIGDMAFSWCRRLTSVTIGSDMTSIGHHAFYKCSRLKKIIFKGKTIDQVKDMKNYPWGISHPESTIKCI